MTAHTEDLLHPLESSQSKPARSHTPSAPAAPDLGALLVAEGVISPEQLDLARQRQRSASNDTRLTRVLIDERITSEQRIRDTVKAKAGHYRIGDLLVLLDLITADQLVEALAEQRKRPGIRLGAVVLERRFVVERHLLQALSYQFGIAYIEPDITIAGVDLMRRMSVAYLRRLEAVPMAGDGTGVTIVTTDPTRPQVAAELRALLRMPVELAIGPRAAIIRTLDEFEELHKSGRTLPSSTAKSPVAASTATAPDGGAVAVVEHLLKQAIDQHASDVHIEPMANRIRIRFRIDGELVHRTDLPQALGPQIASRIKVLCKADLAERRRHQDGRMNFTVGNVTADMRVSVYVTIHGENIVIRILHKANGLLPIEKLGMLPALLQKYKESVLDVPTGVVLFTGPTGSGKTTSLYSSIHYCNEAGVKIITVEDPVEYVVDGVIQCSIDAAAGRDFPTTLREVVRQDPDVIVVGEIRDRETASIAIEAALTGHKVFATFHTEDSIGSLVRLIDMNIEAFLICSTVVSAVAQRLARRICSSCRVETPVTAYEMRLLGLTADEVARHKFYRGAGCDACGGTGFRGRVGLYEMLFLDGTIRDMVLTKRPAYEIRRHALQALGLCTLQEDGIAKALLGLTTLEEVIWHVPRSSEQRPLDDIWRIARETP
jgi:type IV pilus assembly protein PilB